MKDVWMVSAGSDHCVVVSKDGTVMAWGSMGSVVDEDKRFLLQRIDVTIYYGMVHKGDILRCGTDYTCLYKAN